MAMPAPPKGWVPTSVKQFERALASPGWKPDAAQIAAAQALGWQQAVASAPKGVSFEDWIAKINRVMGVMQNDLSYNTQILCAEAVAHLLREHLRNGVEPKLSPFTMALNRSRPGQANPATVASAAGFGLVTLAKHVIVQKPGRNRVGYVAKTATTKGVPGVYARGYRPAVVSFDGEKWDKIAYTLEKGSQWTPSKEARAKLMAAAFVNGLKSDGAMKTGTGVWILPPRPFSHVLVGPEAQRVVRQIIDAALDGDIAKAAAIVEKQVENDRRSYDDVPDDAPTSFVQLTGDTGEERFSSEDDAMREMSSSDATSAVPAPPRAFVPRTITRRAK